MVLFFVCILLELIEYNFYNCIELLFYVFKYLKVFLLCFYFCFFLDLDLVQFLKYILIERKFKLFYLVF